MLNITKDDVKMWSLTKQKKSMKRFLVFVFNKPGNERLRALVPIELDEIILFHGDYCQMMFTFKCLTRISSG